MKFKVGDRVWPLDYNMETAWLHDRAKEYSGIVSRIAINENYFSIDNHNVTYDPRFFMKYPQSKIERLLHGLPETDEQD